MFWISSWDKVFFLAEQFTELRILPGNLSGRILRFRFVLWITYDISEVERAGTDNF